MKLYYFPPSDNARKGVFVAKLLGLDLELENVDFQNAQHKSPEFLRMNPNGKVPVLVDGETTIWESNAITAYLASKTENDLWPKTNARYDIMRWMFWESCHWHPALLGYYFPRLIRGGGPDAPISEEAQNDFERYASVLNGHLEANLFLTGATMTIADIAVGTPLMYRQAANLPMQPYKNIERWMTEIESLDAWAASDLSG